MSKLMEITDEQFEQEVISADKPVLVYFWATWCGPCRLVSPSVEAIASEYGEKLKVVKLEVDSSPQTVAKCKVEGVPAIRIFQDQEMVKSHEGAIGKQMLTEMVESSI